KVKTYIFIVVMFYLIPTIVGIIIIPIWLLGLGQFISNKFFHTLSCQLTDKNLKFAKGFIVHIEKTIPLENIQDLSFIGGPVLRSFGLTMIKVETAGGGGAHHQNNMMSMIGIEHAEEFKSAILQQREVLILSRRQGGGQSTAQTDAQSNLLVEIRDELRKIEQKISLKS
nr:PH domain-containing protein [Chitinophagaceae bacterium]